MKPIALLILYALLAVAMAIPCVPAGRQDRVLWVVGLVFAAAILATGYRQGKLAEGTVPEGSKSIASNVSVNIGAESEPKKSWSEKSP